VLIFDREGYSPAFFKEMWGKHRIACITYHKYPKDPWPETEFIEREITLPNGERVSLKLAERGSWIGNRQEGLWVREIRKLTTSGQTYDKPSPPGPLPKGEGSQASSPSAPRRKGKGIEGRVQLKWNEIQNTPRHVQMLANYLLVQYNARI
jgi:hypothetical protein